MEDSTKTDRIKISGATNSPEKAQNIFKEIQEKTGAVIQWELNKFTSTFKRDPIIKLCGTSEAVKSAREMIIQNLEIQSNRIVLKMDVTYEEHPSLIGKRGCQIKKVKESTNCHIHFPDMNKISTAKSNQVSITGEPSNVESAKIMLRALLPFQVEIENVNFVNTSYASFWNDLDKKFGLGVHFSHHKNNSISAIIRCSQGHFPTLRQLILILIEFLSGKRESELSTVKVAMDIMSQHQNFVKGPRGSNIQAISKRTGAKITFPNLNSSESKGRTVYITGHLDCVYMAWQEIMSLLPICVVFEISESRDTRSDYTDLLTDYNISVSKRTKARFHIQTIIVKGPEKFSKQILQYRQRVLNLSPIKFLPDIVHINKAIDFQTSLSDIQQSQLLENLSLYLVSVPNIVRSIENQFIQECLSYNTTLCPSINNIKDATKYKRSLKGIGGGSTNSDTKTFFTKPQIPHTSSSSPFNKHSVYSSFAWQEHGNNNYEEVVTKDKHNLLDQNIHSGKHIISSDYHISSSNLSTIKNRDNHYEIFEKKLCAHQAIHRNIESTQVPSSAFAGYGFSRSMPATTVTKDIETLSHYSSTSLESNNSNSSEELWDNIVFADYIDDKIWSCKEGNAFSMSNVFDFKRHTSLPMNYNNEDILPRLLYKEGLYNYLDIFLKEEIDYATFLLLNDEDLIKLGFNYPARMKITCLIRELQDAEMKTRTFDAAPGAGRKTMGF